MARPVEKKNKEKREAAIHEPPRLPRFLVPDFWRPLLHTFRYAFQVSAHRDPLGNTNTWGVGRTSGSGCIAPRALREYGVSRRVNLSGNIDLLGPRGFATELSNVQPFDFCDQQQAERARIIAISSRVMNDVTHQALLLKMALAWIERSNQMKTRGDEGNG
jgi:hypothetical protein